MSFIVLPKGSNFSCNVEQVLILASGICQKNFEFEKVKLLTSLKSDHKDIVAIDPIITVEDYSKFIIEKLDEYVDTPHVLLFQYDGLILNPNAWTDEFVEYDYIGAPWLDLFLLQYGENTSLLMNN